MTKITQALVAVLTVFMDIGEYTDTEQAWDSGMTQSKINGGILYSKAKGRPPTAWFCLKFLRIKGELLLGAVGSL